MSQSESSTTNDLDCRDLAGQASSRGCDTALASNSSSLVLESVSNLHPKGNADEIVNSLPSATIAQDPPFDLKMPQEEKRDPASQENEASTDIEKASYILPLTVVRIAGAHKRDGIRHDNQKRSKRGQFDLLKRPTRATANGVKYSHNLHASLDIAVQSLSQRAIHLLVVLSFFHYANIPRLLFTVAAKSMFANEDSKLLPRPPEFDESIQFLKDVLCPDEEWKEEELDVLVEELQKCSIISSSIGATISLRFHLVVHAWVRERLNSEEEAKYQAAALRLLTSSLTFGDNFGLVEHLSPHALYVCPELEVLHVNDRAAVSRVVHFDKDYILLLNIWRNISRDVKNVLGPDHSPVMSYINRELGYATWMSGDRTQAEQIHRDNIEATEAMFGSDRLETIFSHASLARLLRWSVRTAEAKEIERECLRYMIRTHGLKSLRTAHAMLNLAQTLGSLGRHEDRLSLVAGVVEIRTKIIGRSAQRTVWALEEMARTSEPVETEKIQKEVLELRQQLHGVQSRQSATAIAALASRYFQQKRYEEAIKLRQMEWDARNAFQGRWSNDTLVALNSLAKAQFELRHYAAAERSYRELWRVRQRRHGDIHSQTLIALYWVGRTRFEQARHNDAEIMWRQWLEGCRIVHGYQHIETLKALYWLARAYTMQYCYAEAANIWSDRLEKCRQVYGENHITTLSCIGWLAYTRYQLGWFYEAERLRREEVEGLKRLNGKAHSSTLAAMESLAGVYFIRKQYEEAAALRKEVVEERIKLDGPCDPKTLKITFHLGLAYHEQGRNDEAEQLLKNLLEQNRKLYPKSHTEILLVMNWLGKVHFIQERYVDAELVQREYFEACGGKYGILHWDTFMARQALASTCVKLGKFEDAEVLWKKELEISRPIKKQARTIQASNELAQLYFSTGRLAEAKAAVEDSIRLQRRTLIESAPALVKNICLRESITAAIEKEANSTTEENEKDIVEDLTASDPGGDPTFTPPKLRHVAHVEPHYRPFTHRLVFGIYPNYWSMF